MAQKERLRVGLIGYGVGKLYSAALQSIGSYYAGFPRIDLVAIATATAASGRKAMEQFGYTRATTDYREILSSDDIDIVIIATPIHLHKEMLIDALQTDKAIYADKPLTGNLAEARQVYSVARERGRDAQIIFEFRFCPALRRAYELIQEGRLGTIYAFRAAYFRSSYVDPEKPLRWKGSYGLSGGGVVNDYASHLIDLLIWLVGMPSQLTARMSTFVKERPADKGSAQRVTIDTDDHAIILSALPDGAMGTIEAGRMIAGATNDMTLAVYGSQGSLKWNLMDTNYLYFAENPSANTRGGWVQIPTVQSYPEAVLPGADVPVGMMRFHVASLADFLRNTLEGRPYDPNIEQGMRVQAVIEAAIQSAQENAWVILPDG